MKYLIVALPVIVLALALAAACGPDVPPQEPNGISVDIDRSKPRTKPVPKPAKPKGRKS